MGILSSRLRSSQRGGSVLFFFATLSAPVALLLGCASLSQSQNDQKSPPPASLSISTASLPSGQVGFPYGATLAVTGGTAPYSWSLMAGTLPTGLSFNTSTGMINGTPMVSVSQASLTFQVKDSGNPQETRTATLALTVTVAAPTITSLSTTSGPVGAAVTITGSNFGSSQGSSTVTFNGAAATPTSWSATSISVTVPAGATSGNVVVTVSGQASNGIAFTATFPAPSITSLSVNSGPVGTPVTITGANFGSTQGTSTVTSNGAAATPTNWSATSISVTVPAGATSGNVVVTVSGHASNGIAFTVTSGGPISVSVTPLRGGATIAQQIQMTATVTNDVGNAGVMWVVSSGGTLTGQTTVAAAFSAATAGVYTVTAMSVANPGATATATFGVTNLAGVFTYHNDLSRDGNNSNEYALTTANVTSSTFGKLFSCTVDGAVYAQPLWAANIMINGVKRNVVFVATQHDSLYAFDADVNTTPCTPLWQVNLIDSAHGGSSSETSVPSGPSGNLVGGGAGDITPEVGITGTPVIDPSTNILYVVSKSVIASGPTFFQRLHAIDLTTGNERSGSPVTITGTFPGTGDGGTTDTFSPRQQNQRPGLALVNGVVYIAWASHEDRAPYYGWVIGYNVSNLSQSAVLNVTPNAGYGGIWMGGGAPAADSSNNLYLITGNGRFDATNTSGPTNDYGDSFLRLSPGLTVSSYFTPSDQASDDANDSDFGSGGAAMLVDQPSSPVRHLVIGGGKDGALYLLNRDALGGPGDSNALQRFTLGSGGGIFATGAFWNNTFYIAAAGSPVEAFSFNVLSGKFNTSSTSQSPNGFGFPGATPSVSASGTTNGIVWALDGSQYCTNGSGSRCGPAVLHAYDAINLATELWNSQGTGNAAGNAVKFTVPTIANGKVYVGTRGNNTGGDHGSTSVSGELDVYGLLPN